MNIQLFYFIQLPHMLSHTLPHTLPHILLHTLSHTLPHMLPHMFPHMFSHMVPHMVPRTLVYIYFVFIISQTIYNINNLFIILDKVIISVSDSEGSGEKQKE